MRDVLRRKLEEIGFVKLQESIYVFPYDCLNEIEALKTLFYIKPYVQYVIADRIESETDLIDLFFDRGLVKKLHKDKDGKSK